MKPELPVVDTDKAISPHGQEIEFALIISRMINTVKQDPGEMRLAIYEFARAKLQLDTPWATDEEKARLLNSQETAIKGVESFSIRSDEKERLKPPPQSTEIVNRSGDQPLSDPGSMPLAKIVSRDTYGPREIHYPRPQWDKATPTDGLKIFIRIASVVVVGILVVGAALYTQQRFRQDPSANLNNNSVKAAAPSSQQTGVEATAPAKPNPLPFPVPSVYGIYALNNGTLRELDALSEQVPDKRVAMSTPVSRPSRTTLPDGKVNFVVFRRDLVGSAPDRMDIRVVARVTRALTFDAKGGRNFLPVNDAWNIRNVSYEFRVRPIAGNPEMLLVQPEKSDFELPAGRYVLVLKNQGYDFGVDGKITDPSQCLERTDAANGTFYSDCQ